jgi:hypothetical protein
MKIIIDLTKKEVEHLLPSHDFTDCCGVVWDIMIKVQKECKRQKNRLVKPKYIYAYDKKIKRRCVFVVFGDNAISLISGQKIKYLGEKK